MRSSSTALDSVAALLSASRAIKAGLKMIRKLSGGNWVLRDMTMVHWRITIASVTDVAAVHESFYGPRTPALPIVTHETPCTCIRRLREAPRLSNLESTAQQPVSQRD